MGAFFFFEWMRRIGFHHFAAAASKIHIRLDNQCHGKDLEKKQWSAARADIDKKGVTRPEQQNQSADDDKVEDRGGYHRC